MPPAALPQLGMSQGRLCGGGEIPMVASLRADYKMTIVLASHDPQIAARCERLIRLRDGAVVDDIDLSEGYSVQDILRRVSQLG